MAGLVKGSAAGKPAGNQDEHPIILASASAVRAQLLAAAGVAVEIIPAQRDEKALRAALTVTGSPPLPAADLARYLARAKAHEVSSRFCAGVVIGADQVLECEAGIFEKPKDLSQARAQLLALRARRHRLHSAVVLARSGATLWHHVESAELVMRDFSEDFLDDYLARLGEKVCTSVGAYQIEGLGVQLFERITGDIFTIQGLPLLPLLDALRRHAGLVR